MSETWNCPGYEPSTSAQEPAPGKDLRCFNLEDCLGFLNVLGLGHLKDSFESNKMDGGLLYALIHPQLGSVMLDSMGFSSSDQKLLVNGIKDRLKM